MQKNGKNLKMKNENTNNLIIRDIVVGIILILYLLFIYLDFFNTEFFISTKYIKYLSILLCFSLSIILNKNSFGDINSRKDIFLLELAMFITTIADLFIVILDFYLLGVVLFSFVQIVYSVRYSTKKTKGILINFLITFLCILLLYSIISIFKNETNILVPISIFYFICLLTSVGKAILVCKNNLYPAPNKYMIIIGMVLFLLCDICVALSNISMLVPLVGYPILLVSQISSFLIWVFYLPSQLLLALSGDSKFKKFQ